MYIYEKHYKTQKDKPHHNIQYFHLPRGEYGCIYYHAFLFINKQGYHLEMII